MLAYVILHFVVLPKWARTLGGTVLSRLWDQRRDAGETPGKDDGVSGLEAERRTVQSRIARYETFALAVALSVLTGFSLLFAWREPFSVDEYLVRITALSGSPSAVWHVLKTAPLAVDPPLYHLLNVYFLRLFGPSEFSTRLVSVLAYTGMSFFLYRFVRRYTDIFTGSVLLALCLQCGTFSYAYEARPYTLVLGADALALVCWASLAEERKKRASRWLVCSWELRLLWEAIGSDSLCWSLSHLGRRFGPGKSVGSTPRHGAPSQPVLRPHWPTCHCCRLPRSIGHCLGKGLHWGTFPRVSS